MAPLKSLALVGLSVTLAFSTACTADLGGSAPDGAGAGNGSGDGDGDFWGDGDAPVTKPTSLSPIVMRRLNSTEYNNTVRDLLQTSLRPGDGFPTDDLGGGFPTVGSALSLSPAYVISYESAAHALIEELFADSTRLGTFVPCDVESQGETCARQVLAEFAQKAWRRPVSDEEVTTLLHPLSVAAAEGSTATDGLRHAMAAVLISPFFIFKVETSMGALDGYEMASRLSYSLWGTMPDGQLLEAAAAGDLTTDAGLTAQVERMLDDDRAEALLENFAARWLDYSELENHEVNADLFGEFTPELAESMKEEANAFFYDALRSNVPVPQMLTATHTFIDEALGSHYGISAPRPADVPLGEMWKVDATPGNRGGLLTLGALLTHTSLTSRTSPVKRGDFVFKHMLCGEIPPPPPEVEALPDSGATESQTLRERMELHSQDPACAGCHKVMDPIGFGLEHFDAIGRYRTHDGTSEVNASGILPEDVAFDGARELADILSESKKFPYCVTKHFMTYALGKIIKDPVDEQWAQYLTQEASDVGGSLKNTIVRIVLSEPFRRRVTE